MEIPVANYAEAIKCFVAILADIAVVGIIVYANYKAATYNDKK